MSVFDKFFKLNTPAKIEIKQKANAINILINSIHNKISIVEAERLYDLIATEAMTLSSDNERISKGMTIITDAKAEWLTNEEKESFVAGVWLCECARDSKNNKGITYINPEELKYTRQAVLGTSFKHYSSSIPNSISTGTTYEY